MKKKFKVINYNITHLKEASELLNELSPTPSYLNNRCQFLVVEGKRKCFKGLKTFIGKMGKEVVGIASIIIEPKYYHNFRPLAHIEDVVIKKEYRGCGFGKLLIKHCIEYAKKHNCYRAILYCTNENVEFY